MTSPRFCGYTDRCPSQHRQRHPPAKGAREERRTGHWFEPQRRLHRWRSALQLRAENYKIPPEVIEKRRKLREVAEEYGVDLRTAAIQFSPAPDLAVALAFGAGSDRQIREDWNSLQAKVPDEFWQTLKDRGLIHGEAAVPSA